MSRKCLPSSREKLVPHICRTLAVSSIIWGAKGLLTGPLERKTRVRFPVRRWYIRSHGFDASRLD
jgi:hypothetical protein